MSAPLRGLQRAALAEGVTLVLLVGVAVPLKHLAGMPLAVQVMGPLHGLAFVAYVWRLWSALGAGELSPREALRCAVAAFWPGGAWRRVSGLARATACGSP